MKPTKKYILALDQGTTSSRAILFNHAGSVVGTSQREYRQIFPEPGCVEHDPLAIWESQLAVAQQVLKDTSASANEVAAIGITNQRETTIVWDRQTGQPIYNAIVWQDRRTAALCDELKLAGLEAEVQKRTGLVLDPYFSGTKVKWILDNVDGARDKALRGELAFGTVDSWLVWNLTGGRLHVTDVTNASRTMLYNINDLQWDGDQLAMLDIPKSLLPKVVASSGLVGETDEDHFGVAIPISGIAGDQHASLFGQICTTRGMVKNTYGTGCFMLMNTGSAPIISTNKLLTTIAWQIDGETSYALEGSVFVGGAIVQWLRDGLGIIESSKDIEELARRVDSSEGVYLVPAFTGLGSPHWDPYARGLIHGLTRGSNSAHIARAALEGIAFQVADVIHAMEKDSGLALNELRVDGGAAANDLLMQFQSDILGVSVVRPQILETTALGAAYLAGIAAGFWKGIEEVSRQWYEDGRFSPTMGKEDVDRRFRGWEKALARSKGWVDDESGSDADKVN